MNQKQIILQWGLDKIKVIPTGKKSFVVLTTLANGHNDYREFKHLGITAKQFAESILLDSLPGNGWRQMDEEKLE